MRTHNEISQRLLPYLGSTLIYMDGIGYIAYQISTGENVEILFIEVNQARKGYGTRLVRAMVERIQPYHSVFVFRRAVNEVAGHFYRELGFTETVVKGLYKNEDAVIGVVDYETLRKAVNPHA